MMMKTNQIWHELEQENLFTEGFLYRRYSGSVLPNIFVCLKVPEKFRCIAVSFNKSLGSNIKQLTNLRDIKMELLNDSKNPAIINLYILLINKQHQDIFSILVEDLMLSIASVTDERLLIKELLNRFEKWKSLFELASLPGLSPELQMGLYGELFFLRKLLRSGNRTQEKIESWIGPEKQIRDFQHGRWSVEVKTTKGNNHQKVHINGERQLDPTYLDYLFLYHISLEVRQQTGESLNQIVDSIFELLCSDLVALTRFRNKLLEAGYFENHRNLYENTGYYIRQDNFYEVSGNFPRIQENEVKAGLGDIKYSIILSYCADYLIDEKDIFEKIGFP